LALTIEPLSAARYLLSGILGEPTQRGSPSARQAETCNGKSAARSDEQPLSFAQNRHNTGARELLWSDPYRKM
jgi:hypothetical protein